jgi:hypothetical protein
VRRLRRYARVFKQKSCSVEYGSAVPTFSLIDMQNRRLLNGAIATIVLVASLVLLRAPLLRDMGRMLVAEDPVTPADAIVLTVDVGSAGVLEAADLVRAGIATRVAVFADPLGVAELEFARRGYKVEQKSAALVRMLANLGVPDAKQIPLAQAGTQAESEVLPGWCEVNGIVSVVVVASPDHSRRVRRTFRRTTKGRRLRVMVRPTRVATFNPETWWQTRDGLRVGLVELEKLLVDVARHPW